MLYESRFLVFFCSFIFIEFVFYHFSYIHMILICKRSLIARSVYNPISHIIGSSDIFKYHILYIIDMISYLIDIIESSCKSKYLIQLIFIFSTYDLIQIFIHFFLGVSRMIQYFCSYYIFLGYSILVANIYGLIGFINTSPVP